MYNKFLTTADKNQMSGKKISFLLKNSIDHLLDAGIWSRLSPSSPVTDQRLLGDITER